MKNLIKELHDLEQKHKTYLDMETHQKIVIKRGHLRYLMEQETRKVFNNVAKERYKWGNKPGKYLAKISREFFLKLHGKDKKRERLNAI